jgi:hypothetical protein
MLYLTPVTCPVFGALLDADAANPVNEAGRVTFRQSYVRRHTVTFARIFKKKHRLLEAGALLVLCWRELVTLVLFPTHLLLMSDRHHRQR